MIRYAKRTTVAVPQTRSEIERLLERYGARDFATGKVGNLTRIMFVMRGRRIRFEVFMPTEADIVDPGIIPLSRSNRHLSQRDRVRKFVQTMAKERYRLLALCIKAKLAAVEQGVTEFEDEFGAYMVRKDGKTIGQHNREQLKLFDANGSLLLEHSDAA